MALFRRELFSIRFAVPKPVRGAENDLLPEHRDRGRGRCGGREPLGHVWVMLLAERTQQLAAPVAATNVLQQLGRVAVVAAPVCKLGWWL